MLELAYIKNNKLFQKVRLESFKCKKNILKIKSCEKWESMSLEKVKFLIASMHLADRTSVFYSKFVIGIFSNISYM